MIKKTSNQFVMEMNEKGLGSRCFLVQGNPANDLDPVTFLGDFSACVILDNHYLFCVTQTKTPNQTSVQISTPPEWFDHYKQSSPPVTSYFGRFSSLRKSRKEFNVSHDLSFEIVGVSWALNGKNPRYEQAFVDFLNGETLTKADIRYLSEKNNASPALQKFLLDYTLEKVISGKNTQTQKRKM